MLPCFGISKDSRKLTYFDIPTRDNIFQYYCKTMCGPTGADLERVRGWGSRGVGEVQLNTLTQNFIFMGNFG